MEETKKLVQLCHELDYGSLTPEVVDRVKYLLLDYLGVAARGALSESSHPVHKMIRRQGDFPDGVPVIGEMGPSEPARHAPLPLTLLCRLHAEYGRSILVVLQDGDVSLVRRPHLQIRRGRQWCGCAGRAAEKCHRNCR